MKKKEKENCLRIKAKSNNMII